MLAHALGAQDGEARLEVGWVDLGDEAREEAAAQTVLERLDRLRRAVRGEDHLLGRALEVVVGVEELLLEALLALHELHVVDQQDVAVAVAALEGERGRGAQRVDEVVHERLGRDVEDLAPDVVLAHVVPDGVQQVRLAQATGAVDEERVVGAAGRLGHGLGGGVGQAVRRGGHEGLEGELRIELDGGALAAVPGLVRPSRRLTVGRRRVRRVTDGRGGDAARRPDRTACPGPQPGRSPHPRPHPHPGPVPVGDGRMPDPAMGRGRSRPRSGLRLGWMAQDLVEHRVGPDRRAGLSHLEPAADGSTHLVGQGVLDHRQVARLDPFPDQPVGDRQDEYAVVERDRLDPGQPQLPCALRDLVPQRIRALRPELSSLRHRPVRSPILPLDHIPVGVGPRNTERSSVWVIHRTYTAGPTPD